MSFNAGQQRFVEEMGLAWEREGVPRIAGRIFGFLLLQAEPCSLDDMATALGVSRASISTDARCLERLHLVERVSRPGDRRDYWGIAGDAPASSVAMHVDRMRRMRAALEEHGQLAVEGTPPAVRGRLERLGAAHDQTVAALEQLVDRLRALPAVTLPASGLTAS